MVRVILVVIVAVLSRIFLGRKQHRHHWAGIALIVLGVTEVGWVQIAYEGAEESGTAVYGIALLILSQLFIAGQLISEEKLLRNYYLDPLKIVGLEGMWGLLFMIILLIVLQSIECTGYQFCHFGYLENSSYALAQMLDNPSLILVYVLIATSFCCFNTFAVTTTKHASAA